MKITITTITTITKITIKITINLLLIMVCRLAMLENQLDPLGKIGKTMYNVYVYTLHI